MLTKFIQCGFVLLVSLAACGLEARAQGGGIDAGLAAQYFREARAACERDGGKLWGVSTCGPVLLVDVQTRAVAANQADREGQLTREGEVFVGRLPPRQPVANAPVEWAGVRWAMIVWSFLTKDEFQRVKLMTHESFHRVQGELKLPVAAAANNHLDTEAGRVWLQLEWRALSRAVASKGKARRSAVDDALLFRARRRALFAQAAEAERALEMHEGLAEYTGFRLSAQTDGQLIEKLTKQIEQGAARPSFVSTFAYSSGPAYGVLLDAARPGWRKSLTPRDDLGELLRGALKIKPPDDIDVRADRQASVYDGAALRAAEAERERARQKRVAEYRARLVDGPTLVVVLTDRRRVVNNTNTATPLEGVGTVYQLSSVTDDWGSLEVTGGALMIQAPGGRITQIRLAAPADAAARPLRGEGWTLELSPGWTLAPGNRAGDYVLQKSEQ